MVRFPFLFTVWASTFYAQHGQARCGSEAPEPEALSAGRNLQHLQRREDPDISYHALSKRDEGLLIPTYLHVVESEDKAGFVTDVMIDAQVCGFLVSDRFLNEASNEMA